MALKPQPAAPVELFYSYAHEDGKLREKLDNHLSLMERQGLIKEWHDRDISAGDDWATEIDENLDSARLILLLVSDDFMASDYCYSVEMERALERHERGEARVIPVILRPVDWESSPFGKLQALPKDGKPVVEWRPRDRAFKDIAQGIRKIIKEFKPKPPSVTLIPRPPLVGFVARRDEQGRDILSRLREELAPQSSKLVTLWGPGGVGKTTLAAEAARSLADDFAGRLVWSSAEGRASYSLSTLLDDIATQLGRPDLRPLAPEPKKAQVHALVSDPPALVVLDNYETVAPDEQVNIEEWFTQSRCTSLITSRQRVAPTLSVNIAAMSREEAEELLERLVTQTQDPEIFSASVRQRVYETAEANPFLIRWVVAQIDLAKKPQDVLNDLTHGEGNAAERVFDRSFNLPQIGDDGRTVLLALSLFTPHATREALAEVSGFGNDLRRLEKAIEGLSSLWLVEVTEGNERLLLRGLRRELAKSRLSKDARADEFRERFVTYFLRYALEHKEPTPENYNVLEAEKDNLISATEVTFDYGDRKGVLPMAYVLASPVSGMLSVRGYWDEAVRLGEQALQTARSLQDEVEIAGLSHNVAVMYESRGELAKARRLYGESLEIARKLGDQRGIAITFHQLAMLAQGLGNLKEARQLYIESLETKKKLGDQNGIASTLHQLAMLRYMEGEPEEARRFFGESLEIAKRLGNQSSIASTLHQLAVLSQNQGGLDEARRLYNESLEIKQRLGEQSGIASTLGNLGVLAEDEGNKTEAARLFREALRIFEKLGSPEAEKVRRSLVRIESELD
jgi:tetratricopeptide (TPR) repeat protein